MILICFFNQENSVKFRRNNFRVNLSYHLRVSCSRKTYFLCSSSKNITSVHDYTTSLTSKGNIVSFIFMQYFFLNYQNISRKNMQLSRKPLKTPIITYKHSLKECARDKHKKRKNDPRNKLLDSSRNCE